MPHICILTTAHAVDDMRVRFKFANALADAGVRVTWIGPAQRAFGDGATDSRGIKFMLTDPIRTSADRVFSPIHVARLALKVQDVDVFYAPDPDAASIAIFLASRKRARVIFDLHEVYHGAMLRRWVPGFATFILSRIMRCWIAWLGKRVDLMIGVSESVLGPYIRSGGNYMVVRSCAPILFSKCNKLPSTDFRPGRFRVIHGKGHESRGTEVLFRALRQWPVSEGDICAVVVVNGDLWRGREAMDILDRAKVHGVSDRIELWPAGPMERWRDLLAQCDAGLILYGRDYGVDSLPNRLFEYMAVGLPVVAPNYSVEIAKIVDQEGCGVLVDCEDPHAIVSAFLELKRDPKARREMGLRAKSAFLRSHSWELEVQPLIKWIYGLDLVPHPDLRR